LTSLKIADFGLSTQLEHGDKINDRCGTILYMAPEQAAYKAYGKEVDIWSTGIILYKLLSNGNHPLYSLNEKKESYFTKLKNPIWVFHKGFSDLSRNLFLKLMKISPIERYTASQALAHPWVCPSNTEIPKTYIESMRIYDAELKLRNILYTILFISLNIPYAEVKCDEVAKSEAIERRKTISAKVPLHYPRISKRFKTLYGDFASRSPIRPITAKQKLK
jgi:calcium/calmodulin-dependent protein kinase I